MADAIKVGVMGAGWPGGMHAKGYADAGGFKVVAVSDLIPSRREKFVAAFPNAKQYADANDLLEDENVDAVSICLPNHLHAPLAVAALKAGKHVVCEKPPAMNAKEAKHIESAAAKAKRNVLFSFQRRFGGAEQAAKQAVAKGYAGEVYHARSTLMRTRGISIGTGWFTDKSKSGGGAMIDLGVHMLDLAWSMLGQPRPTTVYAVTHRRFAELGPKGSPFDVDDAGFALIKFATGQTLELGASWALNQPPQQQGTLCRMYGDKGAVDVYTPTGAVIYRNFDAKGQAKPTPLKPPKTIGHVALMRHFRECIQGKSQPQIGGAEGVQIMQMLDAIYKSSDTGKSVEIK